MRCVEKVSSDDRGGKQLSVVLQLRKAAYELGVPHTGCGVFNKGRPRTLTYQPQIVFRNRGTGQLDRQRYLEDATSAY